MKIVNNTAVTSLDSIVLFPFDDYPIPFQRGVQLNLGVTREAPAGPESLHLYAAYLEHN